MLKRFKDHHGRTGYPIAVLIALAGEDFPKTLAGVGRDFDVYGSGRDDRTRNTLFYVGVTTHCGRSAVTTALWGVQDPYGMKGY